MLQPLTNFYAVDGGKVVFFGDEAVPGEAPAPAPSRRRRPPRLPSPPGAPVDPAVAPLPVPRTRIVIFIDNLSLQPFNRNRVLRSVQTWVRENVKDNVEAMVVTWDRSLKVRRKFTNDGREISDVLKQQEDLSTLGQTRLSRACGHHPSDRRDQERDRGLRGGAAVRPRLQERHRLHRRRPEEDDRPARRRRGPEDPPPRLRGPAAVARRRALEVRPGQVPDPDRRASPSSSSTRRPRTSGSSVPPTPPESRCTWSTPPASRIDSGISAENRTTEAKIDTLRRAHEPAVDDPADGR